MNNKNLHILVEITPVTMRLNTFLLFDVDVDHTFYKRVYNNIIMLSLNRFP